MGGTGETGDACDMRSLRNLHDEGQMWESWLPPPAVLAWEVYRVLQCWGRCPFSGPASPLIFFCSIPILVLCTVPQTTPSGWGCQGFCWVLGTTRVIIHGLFGVNKWLL